MLVFYQNKFEAYIGIAVAKWGCSENPRTMILIPKMIKDCCYCAVEVDCDEDSTPVLISDAIAGWSAPQENGFGENSAGYPINKSTAEDLYFVWDDGCDRHPERSAKLFKAFSMHIDHYAESANHYLSQWCEAKYQAELRMGRERGFDLSLIEKKKPVFAYDVISMKP